MLKIWKKGKLQIQTRLIIFTKKNNFTLLIKTRQLLNHLFTALSMSQIQKRDTQPLLKPI